MSSTYNWRRIKDVRTKSEVFSGIMAVGDNGIIMPLEGKTDMDNIRFYSCTSFHEGHLILGDGVLIYETAMGVSENKIDMDTYDAATTADGRHVIIVSRDGSGIISNIPEPKEGVTYEVGFNKLNTGLEKISSINECGQSLIISGKNCVKVCTFESNSDSEHPETVNSYIIMGCEFKSAFKFMQDDDDYCIIALCDNANGDRCIYIFDKDYAVNNKLSILKLSELLPDITVNNIYVDENGIFCLCEKGVIAYIMTDDDNHLRLYYKGIVSKNVSWNDMIITDNNAIIVGSSDIKEESIVSIYDLPKILMLSSETNRPLDGIFANIKSNYVNASVMNKLQFNVYQLNEGADKLSYIKLSDYGLSELYREGRIFILEKACNAGYSVYSTKLSDDCIIIGYNITEPVTLTVVYTPEED